MDKENCVCVYITYVYVYIQYLYLYKYVYIPSVYTQWNIIQSLKRRKSCHCDTMDESLGHYDK